MKRPKSPQPQVPIDGREPEQAQAWLRVLGICPECGRDDVKGHECKEPMCGGER